MIILCLPAIKLTLMKKLFFSTFLVLTTAMFFVGCKKETQPIVEKTLESRLAEDEAFRALLVNATELATSVSGTEDLSAEDVALIQSILAKGDKASAQEIAAAQELLGISAADFSKGLNNFFSSLATLNEKYPELAKMDQNQLQVTINKAFELNPTLKADISAVAVANGKAACVGPNICKLAILLAKTFGGTALCGVIGVSTIPVVGGVLCTVIVTLAGNVLTALCDLIPC